MVKNMYTFFKELFFSYIKTSNKLRGKREAIQYKVEQKILIDRYIHITGQYIYGEKCSTSCIKKKFKNKYFKPIK